MRALQYFFFNQFLVYFPLFFSFSILIVVCLKCFFSEYKLFKFLKKISVRNLIFFVIGGTIFFDLFLSFLQYFVWLNSDFSRFFLPPYTSVNYILQYTFNHYCLADILAIFTAALLYLILMISRKYKEQVINLADIHIIFLTCLLLGWPKLLIFIPLFFMIALLDKAINLILSSNLSVFKILINKISFKNQTVSLKRALILAALLVFFFANYLLSFTGLDVLII